MNETSEGDGEREQTNLLSQITQFASVVSGATVLAAVLYDWAYFNVVRQNLVQLLSLSDHVANALEWLPLSVMSGLLGYGYAFVTRRTLDPAMARTTAERRAIWINGGIVCALTLFGIGVLILSSPTAEWGAVALLALFLVIPFLVLRFRRLPPGRLLIIARLGLLVAGQCALVVWLGTRDAVHALTARVGDSRVVLKEGGEIDKVFVMREIEKGLLIRRIEDNQLLFLPWAAISTVFITKADLDPRSRACLWFGWRCAT